MNAKELAYLISRSIVRIESKTGDAHNFISLELIDRIGEHFEGDNSLCFYEMRCQHGADGHDIDIEEWKQSAMTD